MRFGVVFGSVAVLLVSQLASAADAPVCPAYSLRNQNGGNPGNLSINNDDVLKWKHSMDNQFHARGHVAGVVTQVFGEINGHQHFEVTFTAHDDRGVEVRDTVEIIYNQDFGPVSSPTVGMPAEACGDFIVSTAPSDGPNGQVYPASPDGALVHWVHMAPTRSGHHSGYLVLNGVLTGQDSAHAGPRPPHANQ